MINLTHETSKMMKNVLFSHTHRLSNPIDDVRDLSDKRHVTELVVYRN